MRVSSARRSVWQVFRAPLALALLSLLGLVAALLVEGPMDVFWSLLTAAPLGIILWLTWRR